MKNKSSTHSPAQIAMMKLHLLREAGKDPKFKEELLKKIEELTKDRIPQNSKKKYTDYRG